MWYVLGLASLVTALLALGMRFTSTGARLFREGRVTGIVGRKGHGKTLFSVHEMLRHVGRRIPCKDPSCPDKYHRGVIASNGALNLPPDLASLFIAVDGWDDLLTLPHGTLVVIDEAHLWAPAIAGRELPAHVRWYLSQCRKLHHEVVWVSQHEDRVALNLRRQTDEIGICARGMFRKMKVDFFDVEDVRKRGVRPQWTFRYRVSKKLASAYDTYALLQPEVESETVGFLNGRPATARQGGAGSGSVPAS